MKQVNKKQFLKSHEIKTKEEFVIKKIKENFAMKDRIIKRKFRCKACKIFVVLKEHIQNVTEVICLK